MGYLTTFKLKLVHKSIWDVSSATLKLVFRPRCPCTCHQKTYTCTEKASWVIQCRIITSRPKKTKETKLTKIKTLQERKATSHHLGLIFIYMIISHQLQYTYLYTTGTQIIQVLNMCFTVSFFFLFLNLTCMLKKSQSWGLSSIIKDKKDRAVGRDLSQPLVILAPCPLSSTWSHWPTFEQSAWVQEVQTPGNLFKCTQTAEECRNNPNVLPPFITARRKLHIHFSVDVQLI